MFKERKQEGKVDQITQELNFKNKERHVYWSDDSKIVGSNLYIESVYRA